MAHALLALGLWALAMYSEVYLVPAIAWLNIVWSWALWPFLLMLIDREAVALRVSALIVGGMLLLPMASDAGNLSWIALTGHVLGASE